MTIRTRKLAGTIALLIMLIVYVLGVMLGATAILPGAPKLVEALFYAVAGLAWVLPAGLVISWMHRQRPEDG